MDIHIILNPGAVGTPPKAQQQSSKKTPRRGTPTSSPNSPGSAIQRRSLRSASTGAAAVQKSKPYATAPPLKRHSSLRHAHGQAPPSLRVRQAGTTNSKRGLHGYGEDAAAAAATPTPTRDPRARHHTRRGSTYSSSAGSSATTASAPSPSLASLLLSRAKQHVALEAAGALGRRTRSIMDVVMDLKGPAVAYEEDVLLFIAERTHDIDAPYLRRDYAFTDDGGLAAYWADQAVIWDGGAREEDALIGFPVSMERSTAAWECSDTRALGPYVHSVKLNLLPKCTYRLDPLGSASECLEYIAPGGPSSSSTSISFRLLLRESGGGGRLCSGAYPPPPPPPLPPPAVPIPIPIPRQRLRAPVLVHKVDVLALRDRPQAERAHGAARALGLGEELRARVGARGRVARGGGRATRVRGAGAGGVRRVDAADGQVRVFGAAAGRVGRVLEQGARGSAAVRAGGRVHRRVTRAAAFTFALALALVPVAFAFPIALALELEEVLAVDVRAGAHALVAVDGGGAAARVGRGRERGDRARGQLVDVVAARVAAALGKRGAVERVLRLLDVGVRLRVGWYTGGAGCPRLREGERARSCRGGSGPPAEPRLLEWIGAMGESMGARLSCLRVPPWGEADGVAAPVGVDWAGGAEGRVDPVILGTAAPAANAHRGPFWTLRMR
ncbi:hypothetical protein B0H17DRAFT_1150182 [Mycena rosella]|uniref:Uncharacterized protein n=1 Tax=Mycena rosella TaxID=1033263 RepID=A0AAD7BV62_MYCRO|nr:hypothetical protein B0H17DRAFT_1150182 [Mycena rosella]